MHGMRLLCEQLTCQSRCNCMYSAVHTIANRRITMSRGKSVLVYSGEGAGSRSVQSALESLRSSLSATIEASKICDYPVIALSFSLALIWPSCNSKCPVMAARLVKWARRSSSAGSAGRTTASCWSCQEEQTCPIAAAWMGWEPSRYEVRFTCMHHAWLEVITPGSKAGFLAGYVEGGGAYLGLCAGAYYASAYVEFDLGTR